ncbi:hypothetical protein DQG23_19035 [Paenibacillus contaminans]|uniref:SLH domain-containing protein n=2 Tax=Paenibacillus contaminans TaxID=450362 RepID=A0A329MIR9_9BACL|nr:hypothetical protein DQG23_19035 [Paenibacillus contaminans]
MVNGKGSNMVSVRETGGGSVQPSRNSAAVNDTEGQAGLTGVESTANGRDGNRFAPGEAATRLEMIGSLIERSMLDEN